jgi:hypothetical protein
MSELIPCPYCTHKLKNEKALTIHARMKHGVSSEELYLKYKLNGKRPVCKCGCGQYTEFSRWAIGYKDYVNLKHRSALRKKNTWETRVCQYKKCNKEFETPQHTDLKYCCPSHAGKAESTKKARRKTVKEKYGVENVSELEEVKEKRTNTIKDRYGVESPLHSEELKKKLQETNLKRYGKKNTFQVEKFKEKSRQTNLEKRGVPYAAQCSDVLKKIKETHNNKYGKYFTQTDEFQEKLRKTSLERYGVPYPAQAERIRTKMSTAILHNAFENIKKYKEVTPLFSRDEYKGVYNKYPVMCNICGNIVIGSYTHASPPRCLHCYPMNAGLSKSEREVAEFIQQQGIEVIENDRSVLQGRELDIYIPSKNLAIEYNGLYWHSEAHKKDKYYHLKKTDDCRKQGIDLIHIFSDEWTSKKDIVKNKLLSKLGLLDTKIYARKCSISEVTPKVKNFFLDSNHIQGKDTSNVKLGLYYKDMLVGVMTFSKPRISLGQKERKEGHWELSRFATSVRVVGGASKLLTHFIKNYTPEYIYSYADLRWTGHKNSVYEAIGMKLAHQTKPNYWYVGPKGYKRYHRFSFRKSELSKKLESFDASVTEYENMLRHGYVRIWDCGNLKYEWIKE